MTTHVIFNLHVMAVVGTQNSCYMDPCDDCNTWLYCVDCKARYFGKADTKAHIPFRDKASQHYLKPTYRRGRTAEKAGPPEADREPRKKTKTLTWWTRFLNCLRPRWRSGPLWTSTKPGGKRATHGTHAPLREISPGTTWCPPPNPNSGKIALTCHSTS